MMKIKHILLFFPLFFSVAAWADDNSASAYYDEIYLKDGSIYHGFISEQLNTGDILIKYDWAIHTCDRLNATVSKVENIAMITVGNRFYQKVELLSEGDVITFKDLTEGTLPTKTSQIEKTVRAITPGINDLVKMNDGRTYRGHIVEVVPGKTMTIRQENGTPIIIYSKNIHTNARERKAKELSYVSQSPFLEEYEMKNGLKYTGLRINQDFSQGMLILYDTTDIPTSFELSEVKVIRKYIRDDMTIVRDHMAENEILINGVKHTGIASEQAKSVVMIPADKPLPFIMLQSGKLVVEVDNDQIDPGNGSAPYSLFEFNPVKTEEGKQQVYRLDPLKSAKGKVTLVPDSSEKGNVTTKYIYDDVPLGIYALYNTKTHNIFLIWVN